MMRKTLTIVLCASVLVVSAGCNASTLTNLANLAGVDLGGLDVNALISQAQSIVAQAGTGSLTQEISLVSKTSAADTPIPWFNPWR